MTDSLENKIISTEVSPRGIFSYQEALKASMEYFNGDSLAADTFLSKYAMKSAKSTGAKNHAEIELYEKTPTDMHKRLAKEFARIESKYDNPTSEEKFFELLDRFKYIVPQGSPMAGIGNNNQTTSLSNCFVIGNENGSSDSYGAIMKTDQEQVQLMKRRGGVGHDLSGIRPSGMPVLNSALTSTGVVPFAERYSNSTREVAQDGRRGALMQTLSIKHPDAEKFIDAKMEAGKITGANISVKIDDEFMRAVDSNGEYVQQFPIDSDNPKKREVIKAKTLWDKIIHNAWKSAEPGVIFWDTVKRESIPDCYSDLGFNTVSTNPCGEIPLCPYDSCRLLAINLFGHVENPFTKDAKFNWDLFKENVRYAQRMSDDIVDMEIEKIDAILDKINTDPEDEEIKGPEKRLWERIKNKAIEGRRTGTGITGEGDMLAALGITYGTKEATEFAEEVHKTLALESYRSSVNLAKERGPFPIHDSKREENNPFVNRIKESDPNLYNGMIKYGRRNIAMLTIAPTGSVSILTQTTSGIEPAFLTVYERRKKINQNDTNARVDEIDAQGDKWQKYKVFHHRFEDWLIENGYNVNSVKEIANDSINNKTKQIELEEILSKSPYYKATANDVNWIEKVKMQGAIQKWVDHSISCTVNVPRESSVELIDSLYRTAWKEGCKGVTVYRDGSREGVLNKGSSMPVEIIRENTKPHPLLQMKPQAVKYKIKRESNGDSLHVILTSDIYVDDKSRKAYYIPDEDFQIRAPLGAATSVSFAQSGMDRTEMLRGENPNYAGFVKRLQSAVSSEDEGLGPRRIKSIEYAAGLAFEDLLLKNGIIKRDEITGELVNAIEKRKLRKIEPGTDEYKLIMSQLSGHIDEGKEIEVSGTNGKLDKKFICNKCGSTEYYFEAGCHSPKCKNCNHDNGMGCG